MTAPAAPVSSASGTSLAAQSAVAEAAASLARAAWVQIDLSRLSETLPQFKLAVASAVHRYGQAAATAALRFYMQQRLAAGVTGRIPTLRVAAPSPLPQIGSAVDWATAPLWGESDVATAQARMDAAVERLVLNTGRDTIIDAVRQDREAKAWARVPESGACSFCALLATRGAVYKHDTVSFRAHDHCRCHVEPVFNKYEPSAQIRQWQDMYASIPHGKPAEMRRDFRRLVEGR